MRLRVIVTSLLVLCLGYLGEPAHASTTISATIAPVRHVILSRSGHVVTILSNTQKNVTPKYYLESDSGPSLAPSALSQREYAQLIARINTKNNGAIYNRSAGILHGLVMKLRAVVGV